VHARRFLENTKVHHLFDAISRENNGSDKASNRGPNQIGGFPVLHSGNTASEDFSVKWSKSLDLTLGTGNFIHTDRAKMYLIEIEGANLGKDKNNDPAYVSAIAVLSQPRYSADSFPKAKVLTNIVQQFAKR